MILFSFCTFPWWLTWLLPFLLGLLLGWLIWGRLKSIIADLKERLDTCNRRSKDLENELDLCNKRASSLDGDIALLNGRIKEMQAANAKLSAIDTDTGGIEDELDMWRKRANLLDGEIVLLNGTISEMQVANASFVEEEIDTSVLEAELDACRKRAGLLDGEIALLSGAIRELEATSNISITEIEITPVASSKTNKYAALKEDNLQIVEGIGPKMNEVLNASGVNTWGDLASQSKTDLSNILGKYGDKYRIIDPSTWAKQAALARDARWEELVSLQKDLDTGKETAKGPTDSKLEKIMIKLGIIKKWKENDLKAIEGIGPKIAGLLNNAGIQTWRDLSNTSVSNIQSVLADAGDRYRLADPTTWPAQAKLAADGDFDGLQAYQDNLNGGKTK